MSGAQDAKAAHVRAPNDINRAANDFGCLKFAATTATGYSAALGREWSNRIATFYVPVGGNEVHVAFTKNPSGGAIDSTSAGTTAGVAAGIALVVPAGVPVHMQVPVFEMNEQLFLLHESVTGAQAFTMALGDGN